MSATPLQKGWLTKAGAFAVEKVECPAPGGSVDLSKPPVGVLHTTEGSFDSALGEFKVHHAPTFLVSSGRILQLLPLGASAAALKHDVPPESNRWARAQIEVAGFSQEDPWQFDPATLARVAALMGALARAASIPLTRPFPDAMPPKPWATTTFSRRTSGKWGTVAGWFGHVEVPSGNAHWDPGALRWSELLARAKSVSGSPGAPVGPPPVDHGPVTPKSAFHAAPRVPADKCVQFLLARDHGEYHTGDIRAIVRHYYETAGSVGLDPLLLVAQMSEETEHLTSFWSQRPRCNPAGIGVTGKPGEGVSFRKWEIGIRAHVGRVLAYAIPAGSGSPRQAKLIAEALSHRALPPDRLGVAPTLAGLSGRWAKDPNYAAKIAAVANQIRRGGTDGPG